MLPSVMHLKARSLLADLVHRLLNTQCRASSCHARMPKRWQAV